MNLRTQREISGMALYFYQALTKGGKKVTGYLDAPSQISVKEQLVKKGMYPISIDPATSRTQKPLWQRFFERGVSVKDKILFTKQLAVLLNSGVPLLQALELLSGYFTGQLETILVEVKDEIKEGQSLADALAKYPKVFDNIYVQLVRAGEASGKLEVILERLTEDIEKQEALKKRVSSAMQGPIIQLVFTLLITAFLLIKVVPELTKTFTAQGKELPGPTRFIMSVSDLVRSYYLLLLGVLIAVVAAFRYWKSTIKGARQIDEIKLRIPLLNRFTRLGAVVEFCRTLGMLLESGVNLSQSLDIVVNIIDNRVLADALNEAKDKIIKQGKISQYLKQTNIFPPIAIYLINTGEQSGQLDKMLLTVATNYEEDLGELADNLTAALSPILLVIMAIIVGFIVISIAIPMMQVGDIGV